MTRTSTGSSSRETLTPAAVPLTPAAVPALAVVVLLVVSTTSQAGYPLTHWAPAALIVLALLGIALVAAPLRLADTPGSVKLAVACLAAYTALSFLSVAWAAAPGEAWEGANRTLLYLMVFSLFALWRGRGASAALLVSLWTLALVGVATYVALRLDGASAKSFQAMFAGERLSYPVGYPNAAAAQWLMAFWPALLLARTPRLPWALRGVLAGGAVVLADVALLSQSRGSLYATAVTIVLVFALAPERLRTFAIAAPVGLGIGLTAPLVLRVGDRIADGRSPAAATHDAVVAIFLAALLVGLVVAVAAAFESRRVVSPRLARGVRHGVGAVALVTLLAVVVGGLVVAGNRAGGNGAGGNLIDAVRHGWESFKGGYSTTAGNSSRLLGGLGSNRYDFYRVALDEFAAHPLVGIGADNFSQQYLVHGRSEETPRYPHSVELRTLTQTGLLGSLVALVGLSAALTAAWRAMRRADPLGRTVAAAALGGAAYWLVHGSFDWFWEFAGLGASAFALLGIACSLEPRTAPAPANAPVRSAPDSAGAPAQGPSGTSQAQGPSGTSQPLARAMAQGAGEPPGATRHHATSRWWLVGIAGALALAAAASLTAPWLSERQIQSAARIWPQAPLLAYARLDDAAQLNPVSGRAYLVAGSIALRFDDLGRARHYFALALQRVPDDAYATLELGALASQAGEHSRSLRLLERAVRLNPRDPLTRQALQTARSGRRVSLKELNRSILLKAEHLT